MSALKICPQCGTEYELDQRFCPKDGSTLRSQNPEGDLVGSIIADRYHVLKKLGEGGMGAVYLAEHVKMGRKSAVKVMNPGMANDPDAISRFNREAANASRINHPNVCAVYDFGETPDGMIYLAMEFIEGKSLTAIIHEAGALPPARAAEITRQAAEALAVAHDMGIVHRDLKPDNIMLATGRDGSDLVKVVDFGIAKAANSEAQKVTKTGLVVGTPEYMSPEQLAGDKLDGRSDTYSLALVAFNMLTGRLPFPANTVQESMIMRLTDSPRPLSEMRPEVAWSPEIQAVMDRALARDVSGRYQSASEFGRELVRAVDAMGAAASEGGATAVMSPPVSAAAVPKTSVHKPEPVPPTRIGSATPSAPPPVKVTSRAPMMAVAAVVLAAAGVGGWFVLQGDGPQGNPTQQAVPEELNRKVSPPVTPAPVNLSSDFERVEALTNYDRGANAGTARQALAKLDSMAPYVVHDSDRVHLALLQAESNFILFDELSDVTRRDMGCDILKNIEGKASRTRLNDRVRFFLYGVESRNIPAQCGAK